MNDLFFYNKYEYSYYILDVYITYF